MWYSYEYTDLFVYNVNVSICYFMIEGTIFTPSLDDRIKALPNYDEVNTVEYRYVKLSLLEILSSQNISEIPF